MRLLGALLIALALANPAFAQTRQEKLVHEMLSRPVENLVPMMTVAGDSLDPSITITSKDVTAITNRGLIASTTTENSFLRAFVDKKSGDVTAQIYHMVTARGRTAPSVDRATYETPGGVEDVAVDRIYFDVSCFRHGCVYYEDVGIPLSYETLRDAAARYDPANPISTLKYRLFGRSGQTFDEGIPGNEIAAFVSVVERERAKLSTHRD